MFFIDEKCRLPRQCCTHWLQDVFVSVKSGADHEILMEQRIEQSTIALYSGEHAFFFSQNNISKTPSPVPLDEGFEQMFALPLFDLVV